MLKRNLLLINCWLIFIVLAALGKTISVYQDFTQTPSVVISFSSLEKAGENLTQVATNFKERSSKGAPYKEQQIALLKTNIDAEIATVEKKLIYKAKPVVIAKAHPHKKIQPKVTIQVVAVETNDAEVLAINNEVPFEAGAFKVEKPATIKTLALFVPIEEPSVKAVKATKVAEVTKPAPLKEDTVNVAQAAPLKVDLEDEPVFIDYSNEKENSPAPIVVNNNAIPTKAKMSSTVEKAIARELHQPIVKTQQVVSQDELDEDAIEEASLKLTTQVAAASRPLPVIAPVQSEQSKTQFVSTQKKEAKLSLTALQVELNRGQGKALNNFEYELAYDPSDRHYDQGSGEIAFSLPISSNLAVVDGRIVHKDMVRTRAALAINDGLLEAEIPTFSISSLEKFLEQEKLKGEGGFLLVDVQNNVQQTLLDVEFEKSFFLNENFVKTANALEARYHFYVGVAPGNVLVTYQLKNGKQAQRVLFVGLDEMTFDPAEFLVERVKKISLYEQKLFGSELSDLQLSPSDVRFFNTQNTAQLQGLNFYEITRPTLPVGMREYLELGSTKDPLFVGGLDAKSFEVPSTDFRDAVLDAQGLSDLGASCLVQLNLNKKIKEIRVSAEAGAGPMNVTQSYLSRSGEFSSEYDQTTTRAFFLGGEQGVINYRIDYLDETSDTFQSYCSLGSYIVEQL